MRDVDNMDFGTFWTWIVTKNDLECGFYFGLYPCLSVFCHPLALPTQNSASMCDEFGQFLLAHNQALIWHRVRIKATEYVESVVLSIRILNVLLRCEKSVKKFYELNTIFETCS